MIVGADVKGLELCTAGHNSGDIVLLRELWDEVDLHTDNQNKFRLPERRHAKFFVFRILFGGTKFGFANDPDFYECKLSPNQWQDVIDKFYEKYPGIARWHSALIEEVIKTGQILMPHGRIYKFSRYDNGNLPETKIKNFPVQGLGADLMTIYRILLYKAFREMAENQPHYEVKMISSVHDSVVVDAPKINVDKVLTTFENCAKLVPIEFEKRFNVPYTAPFRVECSLGKI